MEQYDELWDKQGGCCAICRNPETEKRAGKVRRLAVDHKHDDTKRVRGLLCLRCNKLLGFLEIAGGDWFEKASAYLGASNQN